MMGDPRVIPLKPPDAKRLARLIVESGFVEFSSHALEEMEKDELQTTDCLNLLRGGGFSGARTRKKRAEISGVDAAHVHRGGLSLD